MTRTRASRPAVAAVIPCGDETWPVLDDNPILNNPYEEPLWHYATGLTGELDYSLPLAGRRVFATEVPTLPVPQGAQRDLLELDDVAADFATHPST